jgi:hypothetical protein
MPVNSGTLNAHARVEDNRDYMAVKAVVCPWMVKGEDEINHDLLETFITGWDLNDIWNCRELQACGYHLKSAKQELEGFFCLKKIENNFKILTF